MRETLLFVLGKEFVVVQRPVNAAELFAYAQEPVDLLIFGLSRDLAGQSAILDRIASNSPFPVLFLAESRQVFSLQPARKGSDWLVKPFNPYDLLDKVRRLLAEFPAADPLRTFRGIHKEANARYLDYPYVPKAMAALAVRYALTPLPVLIQGETGCGQERLARAMSSLNARMGAWLSLYPAEMTDACLSRKSEEFSESTGNRTEGAALFLHGLEKLAPEGQSSLLRFLDQEEEKGKGFRIFAVAEGDLQEKVYRGDFLPDLYFRLAALALQLPPLRERPGDIPALAAAICGDYAGRLGLPPATLRDDALDRLIHYLWFGNIAEMECVLARTLACHRKEIVVAADLLFDIGSGFKESSDQELPATPSPEPPFEPLKEAASSPKPAPGAPAPSNGTALSPRNGSGYHELQVLIHEMAHELKNPMVTIKTFAQLLEERFDDVGFRLRFQETVNEDIDRMDELVEALLEFSRFAKPEVAKILVHEHLRKVLVEIVPECIKKDSSIRWGRKGEDDEVMVDGAQFNYVMENLLLSVLNQIKEKEEIQIDIEKGGRIVISYPSEGDPGAPLDRYMDFPAAGLQGGGLPLRMLLGKILLERNGGKVEPNLPAGGRVQIKIILPVP